MDPLRLIAREAGALGRRLGLLGPSWPSSWGIHALVLVAFGVLIPYRKGADFFDPTILGAYTCLGSIFAAPAAAAELSAASLSTAHARIAVCVLYGELMALLMTAGGMATVYLSPRGALFPPTLDTLIESASLGFLLTLALSTFSLAVTLRFSAATAKLLLRFIFLAALLWFFLRGRSLFLGFVWSYDLSILAFWLACWLGLRFTLRQRGTAS